MIFLTNKESEESVNNDRFKFRVWDCVTGKYISPCQLGVNHDGTFRCGREHIIIEQCTGQKDKNGKLIFEGDVYEWIETELLTGKEIKHHGQILFKGAAFVAAFLNGDTNGLIWSGYHYKIIGNIHEEKK
jgi:uncharacterized phage protein (TIGR01671 family)